MARKEIRKATLKSLIGAIPYAGSALNEAIFDYRSRIQQERLNDFTLLLSEFFEENTELEIPDLKNEDFIDLFEAILNRVIRTKSRKKLLRFRDILVQSIKSPIDHAKSPMLYLELISELSEIEIEILSGHAKLQSEAYLKLENELRQIGNRNYIIETEDSNALNKLRNGHLEDEMTALHDKLKSEKEILNQKEKQLKTELSKYLVFRDFEYYQITEADFLYFKQKLYSKGLLIDRGFNSFDSSPFRSMQITEFGLDFMNFILGIENDANSG
jgi:hypothetical protein